jgi:hypothetical protein
LKYLSKLLLLGTSNFFMQLIGLSSFSLKALPDIAGNAGPPLQFHLIIRLKFTGNQNLFERE